MCQGKHWSTVNVQDGGSLGGLLIDAARKKPAIDVHRDDLYLLSYNNTPRYKVVHVNLAKPDLAKADTVFPAGEAVVTSLRVAKDAVYVQKLDGGMGKLWRFDYKGDPAKLIKLPYDGTAFIGWTDQQNRRFVIRIDVVDPVNGLL